MDSIENSRFKVPNPVRFSTSSSSSFLLSLKNNGENTDFDSSTLGSEFNRNYIGNGRRFTSDKIRVSETGSNLGRSSSGGSRSVPVVRGLLWLQKGGSLLFSRWKERYFILTKDYLQCFKKSSENGKISEMGNFLFKVKLTDISKLEWSKQKSYSTIVIQSQKNDKLVLRCNEGGVGGLLEWYDKIQSCRQSSEERLKALKSFSPTTVLQELRTEQLSNDATNTDALKYLHERTSIDNSQRNFHRDFNLRRSCFERTSLKNARLTSMNRVAYVRSNSATATNGSTAQNRPLDAINPTTNFRTRLGNYKRSSLKTYWAALENRKSNEFAENVCFRSNRKF